MYRESVAVIKELLDRNTINQDSKKGHKKHLEFTVLTFSQFFLDACFNINVLEIQLPPFYNLIDHELSYIL